MSALNPLSIVRCLKEHFGSNLDAAIRYAQRVADQRGEDSQHYQQAANLLQTEQDSQGFTLAETLKNARLDPQDYGPGVADQWLNVVHAIADGLARTNHGFDKQRFLKAAGAD